MKHVFLILSVLFLFLALCSNAFATSSYTDDMSGTEQNNFRTLSNLQVFPMDAGGSWQTLPDRTALTFAAASNPNGWVDYRIQNAQQITVGLYSLSGTFVNSVKDGSGDTVLGLRSENTSGLSLSALVPANFSPSDQTIYAQVGGILNKVYLNDFGFIFAPCEDTPADLTGYGVNVFASATGTAYTKVQLHYTKLSFAPASPFCYEELSGNLPADTAYIRVQLNDARRYPILGTPGAYQAKGPKQFNCLASVALQGNDLLFGEPEPEVEEPSPESSSPTTDTGKNAAAKKEKRTAQDDDLDQPSSKSSNTAAKASTASKFEGVISFESSSKSGKASTSSSSIKASSKKDTPPAQQPAAQEIPDAVERTDPEIYYHVSQQPGNTAGLSIGITVYMILILGAMLAVILVRRHKNN